MVMADETSCLVRLNRPKILVRHYRIWSEPSSAKGGKRHHSGYRFKTPYPRLPPSLHLLPPSHQRRLQTLGRFDAAGTDLSLSTSLLQSSKITPLIRDK